MGDSICKLSKVHTDYSVCRPISLMFLAQSSLLHQRSVIGGKLKWTWQLHPMSPVSLNVMTLDAILWVFWWYSPPPPHCGALNKMALYPVRPNALSERRRNCILLEDASWSDIQPADIPRSLTLGRGRGVVWIIQFLQTGVEHVDVMFLTIMPSKLVTKVCE